MTPPRRRVLAGALVLPLLASGCAPATVQTFADWPVALRALDRLGPDWHNGSDWDLARVLHHLAQSIEFSLRGFPELRSAAFRATVGPAAFAWFDLRGRMQHGLTEPIPGAPALANGQPLVPAIQRLRAAVQAFEAHDGALQPHFAYGALDKAAYRRAHLMHLADHWTVITPPTQA